jgi:hypothetical protein
MPFHIGPCNVIPRVPHVSIGRARLAEKQHERARDHHYLELVDDPDESRLAGDHVVERRKPRPSDRTGDVSGGGREVLCERYVHGLGIVVE